MKLIIGMIFTGNEHCFQGRVKVLEIDETNNILKVGLTIRRDETEFDTWYEDWNLQHTLWGFESGEYFLKDFPEYP